MPNLLSRVVLIEMLILRKQNNGDISLVESVGCGAKILRIIVSRKDAPKMLHARTWRENQ